MSNEEKARSVVDKMQERGEDIDWYQMSAVLATKNKGQKSLKSLLAAASGDKEDLSKQ